MCIRDSVTALPDLYFDGDVRDWDARVAFEQALRDLRRYGGGGLRPPSKFGGPAGAGSPLQLAVAVFCSAPNFTPTPSRKRFFEQTCAAATEVWKFSLGEGGRAKLEIGNWKFETRKPERKLCFPVSSF